jgi:DNA excision repair protein ERCC-2
VLFSATLRPPGFFRDRFGCGEETDILTLPSPFPREHRLLMVADRVSTLYRHRELTRDEIARLIATFALERLGNYIAFFPSYQYLRMVADRIAVIAPGLELLIQDRGMSENARTRFLDRFEHCPSGTLLGLAVMGGIFGEGIDLAGERLTGAVIVGVGLPGLSLERDLIREYHDAEGADGYDIAYRLPGIARVFQAAGRVIRSETDSGAILLVDQRFAEPRYRRLYPSDWRLLAVRNPDGMAGLLRRFWHDQYT